MNALALAILVVAAQLGPDDAVDCGRARCSRTGGRGAGGQAPAFFEFAPASGAGMGGACACTTPTGSKGEAMTFARASSGTCLKGNAAAAIATGDMVTCASGQPRVMSVDGSAVNGLLKESARTNLLLRSEEFGNIAWSSQNGTVAAPVITADQAVAPDGTTTADRAVYPATSGAAFSFTFQSATCAAANLTDSIFVRGNASSGSLQMRVTDGTANTIVNCPYVATSWSHCEGTIAANTGTCYLEFGGLAGNGGTTTTANDVFIWGAQMEQGSYASSYIKTTSAAATRALETAQFTVSFPTNLTGSMAATIVATSSLTDADHGVVAQSTAGPTYAQLLDFVGATPAMNLYFTAGAASRLNSIMAPLVPVRVAGFWNHATLGTVCFGGSCSATLATPPTSTTTIVEIGQYNGTAQFNGVVKQVCIDPNPLRCR